MLDKTYAQLNAQTGVMSDVTDRLLSKPMHAALTGEPRCVFQQVALA